VIARPRLNPEIWLRRGDQEFEKPQKAFKDPLSQLTRPVSLPTRYKLLVPSPF
jgi:hypothetical protein